MGECVARRPPAQSGPEFLRQHDFFGLVPEWKFFAPIPGRGDFHLLFRDFFPQGTTDGPQLDIGGPRRWWNFLWHPHRREKKAAFDAARESRASRRQGH